MTIIFLAHVNPSDKIVDVLFREENGRKVDQEVYYPVVLYVCQGLVAVKPLHETREHRWTVSTLTCVLSRFYTDSASSMRRLSSLVSSEHVFGADLEGLVFGRHEEGACQPRWGL